MTKISVFVQECAELNLKPCPFCGTNKLIIQEDESNGKTEEWVECTNPRCGCMGPMWRRTRNHALAVKYWNNREYNEV